MHHGNMAHLPATLKSKLTTTPRYTPKTTPRSQQRTTKRRRVCIFDQRDFDDGRPDELAEAW